MADSDSDGTPADIYQAALPSISPLIGKKSNFTNVTNCLFGRKLITVQELNGITSQQNLTDDERGSKVAFILYEKIEESAKSDPRDGPVRCLMTICDVFENQIINDASLKTHAASMRSKIASGRPPQVPTIQHTQVGHTMTPKTRNKAASDRLREVSDRLACSISSCLMDVTSKLYAGNVIGLSLKDEMINGHDIDSRKATKLVNELQRALDNHTRPDTYLDEMCRVLRNVREKQITDIVDTLSSFK